MIPLAEGAEFDAIRRMIARWGAVASGIGDDAALLDVPRGDRLVASTDASIEGRHFRRDWLSPSEIGYRAVTAALSDIAAMAATPIGVLVALAVPDTWRASLDEIADGIGEAARSAETRIVGGNISGSTELSITATVLGHAFRPLTRAGARAGDTIFVTGRYGGPRSAIDSLEKGESALPGHRERLAKPRARIAEARWLERNGARAMIDVSDGLAGDLAHLAVAGGVRLEVRAELVPAVEGATVDDAIASGEEYELIVTAPFMDASAFASTFALPLTPIGRVVEGAGVDWVGASPRVARARGHDHFSP